MRINPHTLRAVTVSALILCVAMLSYSLYAKHQAKIVCAIQMSQLDELEAQMSSMKK